MVTYGFSLLNSIGECINLYLIRKNFFEMSNYLDNPFIFNFIIFPWHYKLVKLSLIFHIDFPVKPMKCIHCLQDTPKAIYNSNTTSVLVHYQIVHVYLMWLYIRIKYGHLYLCNYETILFLIFFECVYCLFYLMRTLYAFHKWHCFVFTNICFSSTKNLKIYINPIIVFRFMVFKMT